MPPTRPPAPPSIPRARRRRLALVAGPLALLVVELLLQLSPWKPPSRADLDRRLGRVSIERYYELRDDYVLRHDDDRCGPGLELAPAPGIVDSTMQWQRYPCAPTGDRLRVVALGGSSTRGFRVDDADTFPAQLARQLAGQGRPAEVINAGVCGHNTVQIRGMLPAFAALEPDVWVLYAGHNDHNFFAVADAAELTPGWVRWVRASGDRSMTWRLVRGLVHRVHSPRPAGPLPRAGAPPVGAAHRGGPGPRPTPASRAARREEIAREHEARRLIEARFADSARTLAAQARADGASLVLVAPVARIDQPPTDSVHWRDLDDGTLARWQAEYAGLAGPDGRDPAGSTPASRDAALEAALAIDDTFAGLRFRAGQRALGHGDPTTAAQHFTAAWDHVPPSRCDRAPPGFRSVVAEVADEVGAVYVDPWPRFAGAATRTGLPGEELFLDGLHPNAAGHALLAEEIAAALERVRSGETR